MRETRSAHDLLRRVLVVLAIGTLGAPALAAGWLPLGFDVFELGLAAWIVADSGETGESDGPREAAPERPDTVGDQDGSDAPAATLGEPDRKRSGGLGDEGIGPWPSL